jgi:hypothetical protein
MSPLSLLRRELGLEKEMREDGPQGASGRRPVLAWMKESLESVRISNVVAYILVDCVKEIQNFESWKWDCSLWPMEMHLKRFHQ